MPMMTISQLPKITAPSEAEVPASQQPPPDIGFASQRGPGSIETQHLPFPVGVSLASARIGDASALPFVSGSGVNSLMITRPLIDSENLIATSNKDQKEVLQNIIPGLNGPGSFDIKMETVERSFVSLSAPMMTSTQNIMFDSNNNEMREASLFGPSGINKSGPVLPGAFVLEPIKSTSTAPITTMSGGTLGLIPPVINLTVEQQASLSRSAFVRIIEAYKQVSLAGGCELRVALLSRLVDRCGADYDVRELLQKHILSDYQNLKGHELTLHVLHQLFGEMVSQEKNTGSTLEVASIYESFLLIVAKTLRDFLPASDKSLSKIAW
ncbi:hypothetical protein KI387_042012 [Taxus chinensis]|uniref:Uncharacterized protein n=1 Tax=Taxus chinensis TaxID=29808 RepID=A0AA38C3R0_TAXCH|nr:hypothetical protein KI387_042012 [Taxus chinensis]